MIDLEPIPAEEKVLEKMHQGGTFESHGLVDIMENMTRFDNERLRQLIENHANATGSKRARMILDDWAGWLPKFRKVMPVEYRRALEEIERAQLVQAAE
jgi:glutamate synthase (NADPH) large chain